jgi:hypothetical protein
MIPLRQSISCFTNYSSLNTFQANGSKARISIESSTTIIDKDSKSYRQQHVTSMMKNGSMTSLARNWISAINSSFKSSLRK